jgi:hypothetical protein
MKKKWVTLLTAYALGIGNSVAIADPVVPEGYTVENYASGVGAATALAIGPDGLLYITDYASGQLLRRQASGALQVVASGLSNSSALAILPSGRIFAGANDSYVYEIVGGVPQVFASGFSYITSMAVKGTELYVTNSGGNSISRVSTTTGAVSSVLSGVTNPFGVSFDALGNMYFISHAVGEIYTYNFADPPRRLVTITPSGGTYTGFAFDGRLFWSDYRTATLYTLGADGTAAVFATGFAGGASPPSIGPLAIVAQGPDVVFVADGHNVWRIERRPEAPGVLQERSMHLSQRNDGGWVARCTVQYSGVNGKHTHRVALDVVGPGVNVGRVSAVVGPTNRSFMVQDAGVQAVKFVLSQSQLWLERAVHLSSAPARGDVYWCEGSGQDITSGGYLRTTHMEDVSR